MSAEHSSLSGQDTFIQDLRKQTGPSHQKLEENALSKALLDPGVNMQAYQAYLAALYGVTVSFETSLATLIQDIIPDIAQRSRAHLIVNDLLATGFTVEQIADLPVYHHHLPTKSGAMGAMYVLEGSTLGGRILYKHIHKTLGLTVSNGASYFWGYGEETGIMWKSFVSKFTQFAIESGQSAEIIDSAVQTFTIIDHWLDEAVIEK